MFVIAVVSVVGVKFGSRTFNTFGYEVLEILLMMHAEARADTRAAVMFFAFVLLPGGHFPVNPVPGGCGLGGGNFGCRW